VSSHPPPHEGARQGGAIGAASTPFVHRPGDRGRGPVCRWREPYIGKGGLAPGGLARPLSGARTQMHLGPDGLGPDVQPSGARPRGATFADFHIHLLQCFMFDQNVNRCY
jgi:hypothetical protein